MTDSLRLFIGVGQELESCGLSGGVWPCTVVAIAPTSDHAAHDRITRRPAVGWRRPLGGAGTAVRGRRWVKTKRGIYSHFGKHTVL